MQGGIFPYNISIILPLCVLDIRGIFSVFTTLSSTNYFFTSLKIMLKVNYISSMLVHMKVMSLNCGIIISNTRKSVPSDIKTLRSGLKK